MNDYSRRSPLLIWLSLLRLSRRCIWMQRHMRQQKPSLQFRMLYSIRQVGYKKLNYNVIQRIPDGTFTLRAAIEKLLIFMEDRGVQWAQVVGVIVEADMCVILSVGRNRQVMMMGNFHHPRDKKMETKFDDILTNIASQHGSMDALLDVWLTRALCL